MNLFIMLTGVYQKLIDRSKGQEFQKFMFA